MYGMLIGTVFWLYILIYSVARDASSVAPSVNTNGPEGYADWLGSSRKSGDPAYIESN